MKYILTMGRASGKSMLMRTNLKSGYQVVYDNNCARLYYIDNVKMSITTIDEAHKDISPIKYEHLLKLGKKIK